MRAFTSCDPPTPAAVTILFPMPSAAAPPLPRVIANFALTADGKIATRNHTPSLFSSSADKRRLLEIRALGDAVLVGRGTVAADAMTMGLPDAGLRAERSARGQEPFPLRAIVSASGRIDPMLRVFHSEGGPVHVFSTAAMPQDVRRRLHSAGVRVHCLEAPLDPAAILSRLRAEAGVRTVVCEGGAQLFRSLVEADLVDELRLTWCATIFGGVKAPGLIGTAEQTLAVSRALQLRSMEPGGEGEVFLRYVRDAR